MLRKIAEIKVPKGAGPREAKTNPIFATYDRQGAAFAFFFSDSNIAGAAANLLFMVDGQKVFVDDGVTLGETNETHTFTYPLPDKLLNYTGKVDGYLYFDFEDGSHSDEIHFVFTIKKSQIDEEMEDVPDVYIKSFEEVKADVQSTADKATSDIKSRVDAVENAKNSTVGDIEKAKDDAESQIGDYVGEVESSKNSTIEDISSSVSDVQSKASEASEDISNLIKSTEDARDNAVKSMNEIDYSNRNLLLDSDVPVKNSSYQINSYRMSENMENDIYTLTIKGNLGEGKTKFVPFIGNGDNRLGSMKDLGDGYHKLTFRGKVPSNKPSNKLIIYVYPSSAKTESSIEWAKLNHGTLTTPWTPAPEDVGTKRELEKIKQAVINLGGSI